MRNDVWFQFLPGFLVIFATRAVVAEKPLNELEAKEWQGSNISLIIENPALFSYLAIALDESFQKVFLLLCF